MPHSGRSCLPPPQQRSAARRGSLSEELRNPIGEVVHAGLIERGLAVDLWLPEAGLTSEKHNLSPASGSGMPETNGIEFFNRPCSTMGLFRVF